MEPLIIEAAVNGNTTRERNPHVPLTPDEIAKDAKLCLAAGAHIIHHHAEDVYLTGAAAAEQYLAAYRPIAEAFPLAIFAPGVCRAETLEARISHNEVMARTGLISQGIFDPGSFTVATPGEPGKRGRSYINTFDDIQAMAKQLGQLRLGPSIAVFDPGFLRNTLSYHRGGALPAGAWVKFYFQEPDLAGYGLAPTAAALDAYFEIYRDCPLPWSVGVQAGDVTANGLAAVAIARGGHVRVGLEDHLGPGKPTNAELVEQVVALAHAAGRPIATPEQARRRLNLPRQTLTETW
jgi:uncharacterized protein (DUF849 family)